LLFSTSFLSISIFCGFFNVWNLRDSSIIKPSVIKSFHTTLLVIYFFKIEVLYADIRITLSDEFTGFVALIFERAENINSFSPHIAI
jgi:hypothetical protein